MTSRILAVGAALLVSLAVLAGTAQADVVVVAPDGTPLPTSDPAHMPMVESLEPVAEAYWAQRGITLPLPVEVFVAPDIPEVESFAEEPGQRVWLTESLLALRGWHGRVVLCDAYLHERGHNAGLSHDSGDPIMDVGAALLAYPHHVPPKCEHWAEGGFRAALRLRQN